MGRTAATKIGFTGHQGLSVEVSELVRKALSSELSGHAVHGFCSLAEGSDQIFAQLVLELNGTLTAVIPSRGYESTFNSDDALARFEKLLLASEDVIRLEFTKPTEEAFWAAGQRVVEESDRVIAVWDGKPAGGLGGTADVVAYAEELGKPVSIVWPKNAKRS